MYLLEPDCVLVSKSVMRIITPNSIPNVYNASPFWILSDMIMSMQIYILQKAIHIENQGNLQTILQTISSIAKMIRNVIGCVYVLEQGPSYYVFALEVWSPNFLLPKTKMKVHFLWTKYNIAKHWNPTLST